MHARVVPTLFFVKTTKRSFLTAFNERPTLEQFLLLSLLLHALIIMLFGDTAGTGAQLSDRLWGTSAFKFNATLQSDARVPEPGLKLDRGSNTSKMISQRQPRMATELPPTTATAETNNANKAAVEDNPPVQKAEPASSPVEVPQPVKKGAPAEPTQAGTLPTAEVLRFIAKEVAQPVTSFVVSTPTIEPVVAAPVLRAPAAAVTPTTMLSAPPVATLPVDIPVPNFAPPPVPPAPLVIPAPKIERTLIVPVPPKLETVPVEIPIALPPAPVVRSPVAETVVPLKVDRVQKLPEPKIEPRIEVRAVTKPPEITVPEVTMPDVKLPDIRLPEIKPAAAQPPAIQQPAMPPAEIIRSEKPVAPASSETVSRATEPVTTISPATALPRTPPTKSNAGDEPFGPGSSAVPVEQAKPSPKLDLDALRNRARAIASEGSAPRTLFSFPLKPPVVVKKKEQEIFDKALKRPDCRDAYSALGLAAVIPLVRDAVTEKGCKW